jgi:hypothetical protein
VAALPLLPILAPFIAGETVALGTHVYFGAVKAAAIVQFNLAIHITAAGSLTAAAQQQHVVHRFVVEGLTRSENYSRQAVEMAGIILKEISRSGARPLP